MSRFQWSEDLSVGHTAIDQQHKELFGRVDALLDAMAKGQGRGEVVKVVQFLESYVVTHFGDEEKLMLGIRYPEYAAHKTQHAAFTQNFKELSAQVAAQGGNAALTIRLQREVCDWLINHVSHIDRKLGAFLAK